MPFPIQLRSASRDRRSWILLALLLGVVLIPTACVLWFMSEAMNSQRDVARRKLTEAYRAQLPLLAARLDAALERRAAELDAAATTDAAGTFEACVRSGLADAVLVFRNDGSLAYPTTAQPPAFDPVEKRDDWVAARELEARSATAAADAYARIAALEPDAAIAARAIQAEVRCRMQAGDKARALRVITERLTTGRLLDATDLQGRSIAADALLLALHLAPHNDTLATRLHTLLTTYRDSSMPSSQRLFLIGELRAMGFQQPFPLYEAELLAARYMDAERARPGDTVLRPSSLDGIWRITTHSSRVTALYHTPTVVTRLRGALGQSKELKYDVSAPGANAGQADEWTPAGERLPGWRIGLTVRDTKVFDAASRRQSAAYVWVAMLFIAMMAIFAVIGGQALERQMRLERLKTDLIATVSHELKTPLASMKLLVELLIDRPDQDPEKSREYLELIARENDRLTRLIDNFLTFSRMERGHQKFTMAETTAQTIVDLAVASLGERFESILTVDVADGLPALVADEDALVTALRNLLDNAYKYSGRHKLIDLRVWHEEGCLCFAVRDNGIGIALREQKRIFRRFYQVDRRLSRQTGGTGLGLSIVDYIVRAHGGTVRVTSRPGAGSTFAICLPCGGEGDTV